MSTQATPSLSRTGQTLRYALWFWMTGVILAAFFLAPLSQGFAGREGDAPQSSRIVFFHVPMAITSFVAFLAAATWAALYLWKRQPRHDHASHAAVEVGLVFCILATTTGAVWAKVQWGAYWNWDPRQTSILLAILFYGAYLTMRGAIEDPEVRGRLAATYCVLGFVVAPFLFFILPRMAPVSLHPKPAGTEFQPIIGLTLLASTLGHIALFFWIQSLRRRLLALEDAAELEA